MPSDAEPNRDSRGPLDPPSCRPRRRNSRQSRGSRDRHWPIRRKRSLAMHRARTAIRSARLGPDQMVRHDLRRITQAWHRYKSSQGRNRIYPLLQQIFDIGLRWKRENRVLEYCRSALKLIDDPPPMYPESYGVLIVCAGQTDAKARSRWSRVLRVAEANKAKSIESFIKGHGGMNEIAAMYKDLGK